MIYSLRFLTITAGVALLFAGRVLGAEFRLLPKLRPSDEFSDAWAVSADGNTVAGVSFNNTNGYEAVRWTSAGVESLGAGQPSEAYGVSADGSVIVGRRPIGAASTEAFRWTASGGLVALGDLPGGIFASGARDISADGSVIVGASSSDRGSEAFRWTTATGLVGLGLSPQGFRTIATGVSADGSVVVGNGRTVPDPTTGDQAFRWTAQTGIVALGDLPGGGLFSEAHDVSADGSVIVGRGTTDLPTFSAFRWTEATGMVALPGVPNVGPFSVAEGVSANGNVIVGGVPAMVWDPFHSTRLLRDILIEQGIELGDWNPVVARAVSYDGEVIAGVVRSPTFGDQGFVVRLNPGTFIPEPSTFFLGALAFFAILAVVRCSRR
jgi:probable HAF family extracellular repeat protein